MNIIKDWWPIISAVLFAYGVLAVLIYRVGQVEKHVQSHCKDLDEIVKQFQAHLTTEGIHNTANDRQTRIEYRARVEERLDQLYEGQGKIMRHLLTQRFPEREE